MPSIYDIVTSRAIAAYYETKYANTLPMLGETLFPARKKLGLRLEWIKGYDSLDVALNPSAFDAKPPLRDRGEVSIEHTKMPFFREAMRIGEEDRQLIMTYLDNNKDAYTRAILDRIFDASSNLVRGARVIPEIMRMALLAEGKFTIASNKETGQIANYEYNYDPSGEWAKTNVTTLETGWNDPATSNPVVDIADTIKTARSHGHRLTRAIVGAGTWADMCSNAAVQKDMNPVGYENRIYTDADYRQYYSRKLGIAFEIAEKTYVDWSGKEQTYYPDRGEISLFTDGTLGNTWYGTTPEEADLMSGVTDCSVSIVDTGVAVLTKKMSLPVNVITSVSEIVLPSFENMNTVYNIKYTVD